MTNKTKNVLITLILAASGILIGVYLPENSPIYSFLTREVKLALTMVAIVLAILLMRKNKSLSEKAK